MVPSTVNSSTRTRADMPRGPTLIEFTCILMLHRDAACCNIYLRSGDGSTRQSAPPLENNCVTSVG